MTHYMDLFWQKRHCSRPVCSDCRDGVSFSHRVIVFHATDKQNEASGLSLNARTPTDTTSLPGDDDLVNVIGRLDVILMRISCMEMLHSMTHSIDLRGSYCSSLLFLEIAQPVSRSIRVMAVNCKLRKRCRLSVCRQVQGTLSVTFECKLWLGVG